MKKRKLGKSGLEIAPRVFGCNVFGWTVDDQTAFAMLDAFAERTLARLLIFSFDSQKK